MFLFRYHPVCSRYPVFKFRHVTSLAVVLVLLLALGLSSGCKRNAPASQVASQGRHSTGQGSISSGGSNSSGSVSGSGTGSGAGSSTGSSSDSGAGSGQTSGSGTPSGISEYSFAVYLDGIKLKDFTFKDVLALPQTQVTAGGKVQQGPKLKEVLKAAGVAEYSKVKILGAWQETYTLDKSAVDDTVVLDTANRGTCKLAGSSIPKEGWVRDITRIEVTR